MVRRARSLQGKPDPPNAGTKHLKQSFGPPGQTGLWPVPGLRLPREAEGQFLLVVGDKGSCESNIARALASQAIARGDRVLLHCVEGDVTQCFREREAVLIGAHHAQGWAWDAAADIDGGEPTSISPPRSSRSQGRARSGGRARAVFVDVLADLASEPGRTTWTFLDLAHRLLDDPSAIKARITTRERDAVGFTPLPLRWRIEATFGTQTNRYRRPTRNLEHSPTTAEDAIDIANCRRFTKYHRRIFYSNRLSYIDEMPVHKQKYLFLTHQK